ncbi:hypothetical protein [Pseudomonas inefficax]|uniref:hypothetical protein n=1 Tax=Pseudomonas inefficax TaxID=2078786 RepID=UPI0035C5AB45
MSYFFKGIERARLTKLCAVRDAFDNLSNILSLVELVNTCSHCSIERYDKDFDFVIFSGEYSRALVKKSDGYFTMSMPFQIVDDGRLYFTYDEFELEVNGQFISVLRNAIATSKLGGNSHEEVICSLVDSFGIGVHEATNYYDAFATLAMQDHGYFRFDDDAKNQNGTIHPRYHFDFFFKEASSVKVGTDGLIDIECFYALFDGSRAKHYLREF